MSKQVIRVLLLGGEEHHAKNLQILLTDEERNIGGVACLVEPQADASVFPERDRFDLVVWMMTSKKPDQLGEFSKLSEIVKSIPVIVLLQDINEAFGYQTVEAGAQDFLLPDEQNPRQVQKAVRNVIARKLALSRETIALLNRQQARGPQVVSAICGASDLTMTKRKLGISALRDRHPEEYDKLRDVYTGFLNRALDFSSGDIVDELNSFADRLGMLGAGPRDIVDLHKEAVIDGQQRHSPARAKPFVEEGRIVMCQVLGFLASYYRTLSWGCPLKERHTRYPLPEKIPAQRKGIEGHE